MNMDNAEKPKLLGHELDTKRNLFIRYFHAYNRSYYEILWQLEEVSLLVRTFQHSTYNMWMLNEALYKYAESSISALNWLFKDFNDYPFAHQFLREWRNEYHHQSKVDFGLYDISFQVNGEPHSYSNEYFVIPIAIGYSGRLKNLLKKWFGSDKIATNATVNGLVRHHHQYMMSSFQKYEMEMQKSMPKEYLVLNQQSKKSLGGGTYEHFLSEDEFWSQNKIGTEP